VISFPTATLRVFGNEPEWLAGRRPAIGSSDAQKLWGAVPGDAQELVAEKLGLVPPFEDFAASSREIQTGKRVERFLVDWVGGEIKHRTVPLSLAIATSTVHPFLATSPDGVVLDADDRPIGLVEAKFTKRLIEWDPERRAWTTISWDRGHRPLRWIVQTQHQLMVTGLPRVYLVVFIGSEGRIEYDVIERNESFIARHRARCARVWQEIEAEQNPCGAGGEVA